MALQLWVNDSGHYFVDTALGGIQVGQTWCIEDGDWAVEVNDEPAAATGSRNRSPFSILWPASTNGLFACSST